MTVLAFFTSICFIPSGCNMLPSVIAASTELVFVNFYADWCHFSNLLSPVWDRAAELVAEKLGTGRVVLGKVDCDEHGKEHLLPGGHVGG